MAQLRTRPGQRATTFHFTTMLYVRDHRCRSQTSREKSRLSRTSPPIQRGVFRRRSRRKVFIPGRRSLPRQKKITRRRRGRRRSNVRSEESRTAWSDAMDVLCLVESLFLCRMESRVASSKGFRFF